MDDHEPGGVYIGPCSECGRPLPAGTMRYCVHCGAEVAGDHRARHVGAAAGGAAGERPVATWATGEFRAPSPLDGVTELPPVLPPALPPAPGDAWYSDAWYAEEPAPAEPDPHSEAYADASPDEVPDEYSEQEQGPEQEAATEQDDGDDAGRPMPLVWPPTALAAPTAMPEPPAWPGPAVPSAPQPLSMPAPVWSGAPQPFAQPPGWPAQPPVPMPPEPGRPSGRLPVLPLAAAALTLVVVTTFGLLWLNSRGSGELTASQIAPSVARSQAAAVGQTEGSAADVPPSSPSTDGTAGADSAVETPTPTPSASGGEAVTDVVVALDTLLDGSEAARGDVASTAVNLQSCRVPASQAASTFRRAGDERDRLASEATALPPAMVAAVPGGGDAVRAFIALQQASARADDAFADWADDVAAAGCRGQARHTSDWDLANRYSGQASSAKSRFVRLWNPIAAGRGLQSRSADAI
jgi:hypothetical protein